MCSLSLCCVPHNSATDDTRCCRIVNTVDVDIQAQLQEAGARLAAARTNLHAATQQARNTAHTAQTHGIPETRIAALLGVDRLTVRKWLGK